MMSLINDVGPRVVSIIFFLVGMRLYNSNKLVLSTIGATLAAFGLQMLIQVVARA
jgi:hypothetical protein